MEFGDATDEEAPPPNPKKRELMKSAQLQMISMLVVMNTGMGDEHRQWSKMRFDHHHCQKAQHGMQHSLQTMGTCGMHTCHRHHYYSQT